MTKFGVNRVSIGAGINILVFHHLLSQPKFPPSTRHTVINTAPITTKICHILPYTYIHDLKKN